MGGSGKSQLALHYCRQATTFTTFCGILWIDSTSLATINASMAKAARLMPQLTTTVEHCDADHLRKEVCKSTQCSGALWRLLFDKYDDSGAHNIDGMLPNSGPQLTIITTRHKEPRKMGYQFKWEDYKKRRS
jgi:hypothetical protein